MPTVRSWEHAAGIIWPLLAVAARERRLLTYTELSISIGTTPRSVYRALDPIQTYCLENRLPPLTAIVINKRTRIPGTGFTAWDIATIEDGQEAVFVHNWGFVGNPYLNFGPKDTAVTLADQLIDEPGTSEDVYRLVRDRGIAQQIFRRALLIAYSGCAFCGLTFKEALEGAHIVPWKESSPRERLAVRNGILLCASHHRMFDAGLMMPTANLKIEFRGSEDRISSKIDSTSSVKLHDRNMNLPVSKIHWPDPALIRRRRSLAKSHK